MLKRAQVTYGGAKPHWLVDLPSYLMIDGSWLPITPGLIDAGGVLVDADPAKVLSLDPTVVVELPDDTPLDAKGQIDKERLAIMYAGGRFAEPDYVPPVLSAP